MARRQAKKSSGKKAFAGKSRPAKATTDIVIGKRSVGAFVQRCPERVLSIEVAEKSGDGSHQELLSQVREFGISVTTVPVKTLDRYADGTNHQGICARIRPTPELGESDLQDLLPTDKAPLLLVLDQIQDPHNLGACLRTAEAAGVDAVIAPRNRAVGLTTVVRKVASGAAEFVPYVRVTNLARTLRWLQQQQIVCVGLSDAADQSLFDIDGSVPLALVLGSEGEGLRHLTEQTCDQLVALPMEGQVESLNVSVATGIALYECVRQRKEL